jgi:FixJ family two-component response regulator
VRDSVYLVGFADDERGVLERTLRTDDVAILCFDDADALLATMRAEDCGCIVTSVDLPGIGIRGLIREIRARAHCVAIVAVGREDDFRLAVDLVRAGAAEYVEPPLRAGRVLRAVRRALAAARLARASTARP